MSLHVRALVALLGALLVLPTALRAQASRVVAGPVGATYIARPAVLQPTVPPAGALRERAPRRWPWFVLGGAALGYVGMTSWALRRCDSGCRDDGGDAWAYSLWGPLGAIGGATGGLIVGVTYDRLRAGASRHAEAAP